MYKAIQITQALKHNCCGPVIWGGSHPTVQPEESLKYADLVCMGEGEAAVLDLLSNMEEGIIPDNIENIWVKKDGRIIQNQCRPLIRDLDLLPYQDFGCESHYVSTEQGFRQLSSELLPEYMVDLTFDEETYMTMPSRGCCHSCTFCGNNYYNKNLYKGQKTQRKRSIANILDELNIIVRKFSFIKTIHFEDDAFISIFKKDELREFANRYQKEIGLNLFITGISPTTIKKEKFSILVEAGMNMTRLGIQSGSSKTLQLYKRRQSDEKVIQAANIISEFQDRIRFVQYDIILDNPWESEEDLVETLILSEPAPASVFDLSTITDLFSGE